jgi:uncharacterized phage protein (TIGR01671 family)
MTREIKFRAWDGGMMCTGFGVSAINGMAVTREAVGDYYDTITQPDWKVMQYTGLKDKNGKEIYEGDVVDVNGRYIYQIGFVDGAFVAKGKTGMQIRANSIRRWEVIGNIYENPELIKTP